RGTRTLGKLAPRKPAFWRSTRTKDEGLEAHSNLARICGERDIVGAFCRPNCPSSIRISHGRRTYGGPDACRQKSALSTPPERTGRAARDPAARAPKPACTPGGGPVPCWAETPATVATGPGCGCPGARSDLTPLEQTLQLQHARNGDAVREVPRHHAFVQLLEGDLLHDQLLCLIGMSGAGLEIPRQVDETTLVGDGVRELHFQ